MINGKKHNSKNVSLQISTAIERFLAFTTFALKPKSTARIDLCFEIKPKNEFNGKPSRIKNKPKNKKNDNPHASGRHRFSAAGSKIMLKNAQIASAVSYTHLTLPTKA